MRADSGLLDGASPAEGMCSIGCSTDATCQAIVPGARCVQLTSTAAYCVPGCAFGPKGLGAFDTTKCHGRATLACTPIPGASSGLGACLPRCNFHSQCDPGWFCDPRDGLCRQDAPSGLAPGEACTPPEDGGADECRGACTEVVSAQDGGTPASLCVEGCTFGVLTACGWTNTSQPADALCYRGAPGTEGFGPGPGDLAECTPLCDCDDQCPSPLACFGFADSTFPNLTQRGGFCAPPDGSPTLGGCD